MHDILLSLWFFLPAGAGNVAPILAARVPVLARFSAPIDGGAMFRGQRLLGDHKTWRGIACGVIVSTAVFWLQQMLAGHFVALQHLGSPVVYASLPALVIGPLFGLGALGGDALKSFFKRRVGTPPGKSWAPFDQVDYIIGASLATVPFVILPWQAYVWAVITWPVISVASTAIGYLLGLKNQPI